MASSPDNAGAIAAAGDPQSLFRRALHDLDDRMMRGEPFSGHERNCAFLNTGGKRWATVSHVSGFDFDDDARALAATDWDGDGDVDVWVSNRTAPMVRYLRNDTPRAGDFLTLQLVQDTGNRHAIGARVEVKTGVGNGARGPASLVREVRAGDSYLSQSSRRLHFGLGPKANILSVTVRWPGGLVESFPGVQPNAAWLLRQGAGTAAPLPARSSVAVLTPAPVALPPGELPDAAPLAHSIPLPRLEFTDMSGKLRRLDEWKGVPVFITFVSGEHESCAAQFAAWRPRLDELNQAGLRLFAAGMDETKATRELLASLPAEITCGILTPQARERMEAIYHAPFEITLRPGAPCGFVLDAALRLITVHRGPASVDQLLAGAKRAALPPAELAREALPFPGRWFRAPAPWAPLGLLPVLLRQSDWNAAHDYMMEHRAEFKKSRRHAAAAKVLADALIAQNLVSEALTHYQDALDEYPADPVLRNNLAHCLLHAAPRPDAAAIAAALTHAEEAVKLTQRREPSLLDTLAHALRAAGRHDEAVQTARETLALPDIPPAVRQSLEELARGVSR